MPFLKKITAIVSFSLLLLTLPACALKDTVYTPDEAQKQFAKIVGEEFSYDVVLKSAGKTLRIYLPVSHDIFEYKPVEGASKESQKKFSVEYVRGDFKDADFTFEYDTIPATKIKQSNIATVYSDAFQEENRNLTNAVSQIYFNTPDAPDFIVLVIADIKKGIEAQSTFYLADLKQYFSSALPPEEYTLRVLTETRAAKEIVNDKQGSHLDYKEVLWPDFLAQQAVNRITFKYEKSDFPPGNDTENEILKIIAQTFHTYGFTDFAGVHLHDLRNNKQNTYQQSFLKDFIK